MRIPIEMERQVAKAFYIDGLTKDDICKRFAMRPKTVQVIIGKFKDEFVTPEPAA